MDSLKYHVLKHVLDDEGHGEQYGCNIGRYLIVQGKIRRSCLYKILIYLKELCFCHGAGSVGIRSREELKISQLSAEGYDGTVGNALGLHQVIILQILGYEFLKHILVVGRPVLKIREHLIDAKGSQDHVLAEDKVRLVVDGDLE